GNRRARAGARQCLAFSRPRKAGSGGGGVSDGSRRPSAVPDDKCLHEALIPRDGVCIASGFARLFCHAQGGGGGPAPARAATDDRGVRPVPAALSPDNRPRRRGAASVASALALAAGLALAMPATPVLAFGAPESFAELAEKISPSVVNITTSSIVSGPAQRGPMVPEGSPFEDFFNQFDDPNGAPQRSEALGSGFVISEAGYIVTNNHVIEGAGEIMIEFFGGEKLPAKLIGTDPKPDIALLKVEATKPLPFVQFGNSDLMRVGDWVVAMGNPLGQGFSVSAGIVSARNRELS